MELNRRNFIKFFVGGLGGTLLSPLPWKLMDDVAIWTQNWPWVPVPARGKFSTVNSVCTLCSGTCGIEVRKVGDRVVKIEGRTDYPVNRGALCPLGMAGQQILYYEGIRWTAPMKRVGPRGSGEWTEIAWDEAINLLATRIKALREKGVPEKLAAIDGSQSRSTMALLVRRLLDAVGSPNYIGMPREEDTNAIVTSLMQGTSGPAAFDLENSDFILSFGCPLLDGWGGAGRMQSAWRELAGNGARNKAYLVQIDQRASRTALRADQWLAPFPGTEAALAMGIAHVIIKEKHYHKEFVENHAFGFADWSDAQGRAHKGFVRIVLEKYSPQSVEKITGIPTKVIIALARRFAQSKAPLAIAGRGKGLLPGSVYEFMAVHALNGLTGRINQKGGFLTAGDLPLAPWPDVGYDRVARNGLNTVRLDRAGTEQYPFSKGIMHAFSGAINGSESSPVDTLLLYSANPAHTVPENKALIKALHKIPFIVSFSPFRDETSLMADLILPDHTCLEKMDDIVWPTGVQYPLYALSQPAIEPLYRTKHSGDVIISLGKLIGGTVADSFGWTTFEDALKDRVKGLYASGKGQTAYDDSTPAWKGLDEKGGAAAAFSSFKSMWEALKESGCWYLPSHAFGRWSEIFQTPSKKFEFFSSNIDLALQTYSKGKTLDGALSDLGILSRGDEVYMPHYEEVKSAADEKEYPLHLFPIELINLESGWIGNPPFLNKTLFDHQLKKDALFVEVNPKTAAEYGLKEGSKAVLKSPKGELAVRIHVFGGAMPDVIFIPLGLGHTAYDRYLKGKGVNPHDIIDSTEDPWGGQSVWWNTRVKMIKV
ncbi:MAG TPA: molybdopterin-dependent oxidoreductase [Desulfatiglandales bacterium]|nr:molybdopterin-dependent oxidoreductase [Desulfatiglandales bacterium]